MNRQSFRNTMRELYGIQRLIKEGSLYAEEEMPQDDMQQEEMPRGEMGMDEEIPRHNREMGATASIAQIDERIAKIREICLDGLKEFAEDVNSMQYGFFKKTFLEADKIAEEATNPEMGHGSAK